MCKCYCSGEYETVTTIGQVLLEDDLWAGVEVGHNHIWREHNSDLSDRYVEITFQFTDIILPSVASAY